MVRAHKSSALNCGSLVGKALDTSAHEMCVQGVGENSVWLCETLKPILSATGAIAGAIAGARCLDSATVPVGSPSCF